MTVAAGGLAILTPALPRVTSGQKVLLFLRPNEIELLPADTASAANVFPATVEKATYLGDTMDYRLTVGSAIELRVQTDARHRYGAGEAVRVRCPRVRSWAVAD
jgi:ABC-type Fe3+/spermidine/putrescine transport system ATPase subunit